MHGTAEQAAAYLELNEKDIIPSLLKAMKNSFPKHCSV